MGRKRADSGNLEARQYEPRRRMTTAPAVDAVDRHKRTPATRLTQTGPWPDGVPKHHTGEHAMHIKIA